MIILQELIKGNTVSLSHEQQSQAYNPAVLQLVLPKDCN